jgi:hypothetical protein
MRVELHDSGLDACTEVHLSWPPDGTDQDLILFFQSLRLARLDRRAHVAG